MKIQTNIVFRHLIKSDKKIIVEQGGTRSGKTFNPNGSFILFQEKRQNNYDS